MVAIHGRRAESVHEIAASINDTGPIGWTRLSADVKGARNSSGTSIVTAIDLTLASRSKGRKFGSGLSLGKWARYANLEPKSLFFRDKSCGLAAERKKYAVYG